MDDTTGDTVMPTGQENDAPVLQSVSHEQRLEIRRLMQQYRSQLGRRDHHIGGIDTRTGVTLQLKGLIVEGCHHIKSASDMFVKYGTCSMHNLFIK